MGYPVKITITRDTDNLVGFCLITSTYVRCFSCALAHSLRWHTDL